MIQFTVYGEAKPAGSKSAAPFRRKDGSIGVAVRDSNPKSRDWKGIVAAQAPHLPELLRGPLYVTMTFYRPRPKGHTGKRGPTRQGRETPFPIGRPDVLKLSRGVEDALTGIIWGDDSQIVTETLLKRWGEPARVEITVEQLTEATP